MALVAPPHPSYRLIPSRFPPVGLFDTVATAADLPAAMELAGWTNDRLVPERLARLPQDEWVHGRANSSIILAAFLHVAPGGGRFNGPDLGAWYAADTLSTAMAEVGHHLRREAVARDVATITRTYRAYSARLAGQFVDVRDQPSLYDPADYAVSQSFGERQRAEGQDGIVFNSVRRAGGVNAVAFRPSKVLEVVQAAHYNITVSRDVRRITVSQVRG
ncbi:RES family NAD+ phosphorylase [Devosia sp.]|uniref:RES family NAD+ phosphorylase n=1 Tax=Devosia sp. TaxID=1871048 RepID=UPI003A8CA9DD